MKKLLLSVPLVLGLVGCNAGDEKSEVVEPIEKTAESVSVENSEAVKEMQPLLEGQKMARLRNWS